MAGTLKIHSTRGGGDQMFGHSWLEYCPRDGEPTTYGTWGNNPSRRGNGLFENLEQGLPSHATRSRMLNDEQERKLFEKIAEYRAMGSRSWTLFTPCSTFAATTWDYATGEKLEHCTAGISNPTRLVDSILAMNRLDQDPHLAFGQPQPIYRKETTPEGGTTQAKRRSKSWNR